MYPLFRFAKEMVKFRRAPKLAVTGVHVSTHICWPWDLDPWVELNNGRTLTLFDLGRIPMAQRSGLIPVLRDRKWGITVAGSSVRYRRRIRAFDRFTMFSRVAGWDRRFLYMDQSMWKGPECCNQVLIRAAITSATKSGMAWRGSPMVRIVGDSPSFKPGLMPDSSARKRGNAYSGRFENRSGIAILPRFQGLRPRLSLETLA